MLTATQMDNYSNYLIELYSKFELDVLIDISKSITNMDYKLMFDEFNRLQSYTGKQLYDKTINQIGSLLNKSEKEVQNILESSSLKSTTVDDKMLIREGYNPIPLLDNIRMLQTLKANIIKTNGDLRNLTMTTANTVQQTFIKASSNAHIEVISGTVNLDKAVRTAITTSAKDGLIIKYPTGATRTIESAVRTAVTTSLSQTTGALTEIRMEELGLELVEVTSHGNSRPDHAVWQGKVYTYKGMSDKYPDFYSSTGYGTGKGLKGYNCKHDFFPFIEGSDRATIEPERRVKYNGKDMTEYEASQIQRYNERQIRKWKRQQETLKANGFDTKKESDKVKQWQAKQRDLIKQTGLRRDSPREQIG